MRDCGRPTAAARDERPVMAFASTGEVPQERSPESGRRGGLGGALVGVLALALACSPSRPIGPLSPPDPTSDHPVGVDPKHEHMRDRLEPLADRITAVMDEHHVPGFSLAVVRADEVLFVRGFGIANLERGTAVTAETRFAIGAATQAFTATLAAMLVEDGKLDWDAPLFRETPALGRGWSGGGARPRPAGRDGLGLRDGLGHRSGFTDMPLLWRSGAATSQEILEHVARAEPLAKPRERFLESTVMMLAAGEAVARVSGRSWPALLQERVLDALAMTTSSGAFEVFEGDPERAHAYAWDPGLAAHRGVAIRDPTSVAPARGITSNALDLARFLRFQLGRGQLDGQRWLGEDALAATHAQAIAIADDLGYGMGWFVERWRGKTVLRQHGGDEGHLVSLAFIPEDDLGVVVLANGRDAALEERVHEIAFEVLLDPHAEAFADGGPAIGVSPVLPPDPSRHEIDPRAVALQRKHGAVAVGRRSEMPELWRATGTVRLPESALTGAFELVFDHRRAVSIADFGRFGRITQVIADDRAWTSTSFGETEIVEGLDLAAARLAHPLVLLRDWLQTFDAIGFDPPRERPQVRPVRREPEAKRAPGEVVVWLQAGDLPAMRVTVDERTGDVRTADSTPIGNAHTITLTLSDYRESAGLRFPFRHETYDPVEGRTVIELEALKPHAGDSAQTFPREPPG